MVKAFQGAALLPRQHLLGLGLVGLTSPTSDVYNSVADLIARVALPWSRLTARISGEGSLLTVSQPPVFLVLLPCRPEGALGLFLPLPGGVAWALSARPSPTCGPA